MGTIWIKEFVGGLDTRRMPETTSGGVLVRADNGHISRGGEFEKRAAFVPRFTLPAGTAGLAATRIGLYVFGHGPAPTMPTGVYYQRLQHPNGFSVLTRILSWDLYAGKLYVVAEFGDGSVLHFYDGVRVTDWFDGRARGNFTVTAGAVTPAVSATGSFEISGGTAGGANIVGAITIDGVSIKSAPIEHTGNNATTAEAVAAAINAHVSSPDYTATSDGQTVTITAVTPGAAINGKAIVVTPGGNVLISNVRNMSGGANTFTPRLTALRVAGVSIINAPVAWQGSPEATAEAIVAAVNAHVSVPDYTASQNGAKVNIVAVTAGAGANGRTLIATVEPGMTITPTSSTLFGGAAPSSAFQPGTYVKTIGQKVYSVSGPNTHFSGIKTPTQWTTDAVGAGFIDMSTESAGAEDLVALARYQNFAAVFADRLIQIWFFDPNPELNRVVQVLNNTGTLSAGSVTQFGDNDLFYLDESGLRSLRARDSSNAAATTDIGVPIDTLLVEKLTTLTDLERQNICGLIEPRDGRFWLVIKDRIYVFSFFNGAKVSAWSVYKAEHEVGGVMTPFSITTALVHNRKVYLRSGDRIFVYGGPDPEEQFDASVAEAWLPYLDANSPTRQKEWQGVDAALTGEWEVRYAMQPTDTAAEDLVSTIFETTFNQDRVPSLGGSSHISPRFRTKGRTAAKLSSVVVHFEGSTDED